MLQLIKRHKSPHYSTPPNTLSAASSNNAVDKIFNEDLKVILRATKYIDNPAIHKKVIDFCLSALIAKYAEDKIVHLIENDLQKAFSQALRHG